MKLYKKVGDWISTEGPIKFASWIVLENRMDFAKHLLKQSDD